MNKIIGFRVGEVSGRLVAPVATLVVGLIFALASCWLVGRHEQLNLQAKFDQAAKDREHAFSKAVSDKILALESIASLFSVSPDISREGFGRFVQSLLKDIPGIQALEWIPRVPQDQRAACETAARRDGLQSFQITVRQSDGKMGRAPDAREYFPVYYVEPLRSNEPALGFDLASDAIRKAAIEQSRNTGVTVATPRITLVQEPGRQYGILFFLPVYVDGRVPDTPDRRQDKLRGFVVGVFRIGDTVDRALDGLHGKDVTVALHDLSTSSEARFLYIHHPDGIAWDEAWNGQGPPPTVAGIEPWRGEVSVGGRRWGVTCLPTGMFLAGTGWSRWAILAAGVAMSVLMGAYVASHVSRADRLKSLVTERTAAVADSERRVLAKSAEKDVLLNGIDTQIWFLTAPETYGTVNDAHARFLGEDRNLLEGKTLYEVMGESKARVYVEGNRRVFCHGQRDNAEEWIRDAQGRNRLLAIVKTPKLGPNGTVEYVVCSAEDVTDLRQSQQALTESEERYRAVVEDQTDLVCRFDADCVLTFVNKAYAACWHRTPQDMVGTNWMTLLPESARLVARANLAALTQETPTATVEHEVMAAGGEIRWMEWVERAIFDSHGRLVEYQSVGRDISQRKQIELELQGRDALLQAVASASNILLSEPILSQAISKAIEVVGKASGQDRIYIFESHEQEGTGQQLISQRYEWVKKGISVQLNNPELQNLPFDDLYPRWSQELRNGGVIEGRVRDFPDNERPLLESQGIVSLLVIPIMVNREFWGLIGIDDCRTGHAWVDSDRAILAATASAIGSAITRNKTATGIAAERRRLSNIIRGTNVGTWEWNIQTGEAVFNERWADIVGYRLEELAPLSIQTWLALVHPDDLKESEAMLKKHFAGNIDYYDCECRMRHKNGSWVWVRDQGTVVDWSCDGKPLMMTGTHSDITERKRMEELLRQATDRLALAVRAGGVGTWDYDVPGNRLTWDDQMLRLYGIPRCQFSGAYEAWQAGLHPEDRLRSDAEIQLALRGEREFDTEFRVVWPDGSVRDIRALALVQRDNQDQPVRMIGTNWDITAQKKVEKALRESEANFRTFFESMTDMMMVGRPDGRVLFANSAVMRTLGYGTEELAAMDIVDLHPADKRGEAKEIFAAMFRGERDGCPLPLARKDGALVPVDTRVWSGRWNGEDCIFGISKNLSAEQEAKQRFERLFRNNPALMALSTLPDQRFADVNDSFLKVLGYPMGDIIGRTSHELGLFVHPEGQAAVADKLLTEGRIADLELQVRRKDGTILDGLFSGEIVESQGRPYFLTVMVDLTERKRAEDTIKTAHRRLLGVREEEGRRIAEELHESVCQDLAALRMALLAAGQKVETAGAVEVSSQVGKAADICAAIMNDIRNICYAVYPPVLQNLGLAAALRGLEKVGDRLGATVQLHCDASLTEGRLSHDVEVALFRVAQEAVSNAIRHGQARSVSIVMKPHDGGLLLRVTDDGTGFDVHRTTLGLGLTIMQERLVAIGGTFRIASSPGLTTVTAFVPNHPESNTGGLTGRII